MCRLCPFLSMCRRDLLYYGFILTWRELYCNFFFSPCVAYCGASCALFCPAASVAFYIAACCRLRLIERQFFVYPVRYAHKAVVVRRLVPRCRLSVSLLCLSCCRLAFCKLLILCYNVRGVYLCPVAVRIASRLYAPC